MWTNPRNISYIRIQLRPLSFVTTGRTNCFPETKQICWIFSKWPWMNLPVLSFITQISKILLKTVIIVYQRSAVRPKRSSNSATCIYICMYVLYVFTSFSNQLTCAVRVHKVMNTYEHVFTYLPIDVNIWALKSGATDASTRQFGVDSCTQLHKYNIVLNKDTKIQRDK